MADTRARTVFRAAPGFSLWSVTSGRPMVSVPVLSKTTQSTLWARSSASPPLISTPREAPTPVATMTAVGVAKPKAHGHAMTSTAMPNKRAKRKQPWPSGTQLSGMLPDIPAENQAMKVMSAKETTTGTKTEDIRSAYAWMGAFFSCAVSTRRTIWFNTVSLPTREAFTSTTFPMFTVEPITWHPTYFETGLDSPVNMDSSQ
mmetsp:Transcript_21180/g.58782  ORF Transcript_21180/g.58782 Transcript_21180/m.58782 type:complete len:202 (+) Transcript_21180:1999-2604(+)